MKNEKGQTLIFVLLIMVIALGVGISISSRAISTTRRSTNVDSSSRALAAAEAGVETYLARSFNNLNSQIPPSVLTNCLAQTADPIEHPFVGADGVSTTAQVVIGRYGCVTGSQTYNYNVDRDGILELKLDNSTYPLQLEICFSSPSGASSSLYYLLLSGVTGASPNISVSKMGYNQLNASSVPQPVNNFPDATYTSDGMSCFTTPSMSALSTPRLLRIHSLYNSSLVRVRATTGALRYQGFTITSTATIGTSPASVDTAQDKVKRTVKARKSLPYLPAAFDFAIFSDSDSVRLE